MIIHKKSTWPELWTMMQLRSYLQINNYFIIMPTFITKNCIFSHTIQIRFVIAKCSANRRLVHCASCNIPALVVMTRKLVRLMANTIRTVRKRIWEIILYSSNWSVVCHQHFSMTKTFGISMWAVGNILPAIDRNTNSQHYLYPYLFKKTSIPYVFKNIHCVYCKLLYQLTTASSFSSTFSHWLKYKGVYPSGDYSNRRHLRG